MKNKYNPELLCPAGNLEKMKYAYAYGADAVYAGMPQFSLRARENGFNEKAIFEGAEYARKIGKKFYLTANILAHNNKIRPFLNKLDQMMAAKPDALIMADPGLIAFVKEKHPEAEIHLSVQANTLNWAQARFWYKQGISRIILSRELSIDEVKEIKDNVPELEIETFVHGAICIAHSGRCLLSNYFNKRDANYGVCTNACRWPYKLYSKENFDNDDEGRLDLHADFYLEEKERPGDFMRIDEDEYGTYIMNAKDLMAIEYLDKMMEAGIDSFKLEGRTKSIYYLSMATKAYRMAMDDLMAGKPLNPDYAKELKKLHHRGYSPGFLVKQQGSSLQRYESGVSDIASQEFGAVIHDIKDDKILITPRNKMVLGDEIEIVTPESSHYIKVESMTKDETGEAVESIHGGTGVKVWVPVDGRIPETEYALISRVIPDADLDMSAPVQQGCGEEITV